MAIRVHAPFYTDLEDFTFYHPMGILDELFEDGVPKEHQSQFQWDEAVLLQFPGAAFELAGRLNVSRCFAGQFVSCTFRATGKMPPPGNTSYHSNYDFVRAQYNPKLPPTPAKAECSPGANRVPFLSSVESLCDLIFSRIFPSLTGEHGLVVVAGATATGKSKIARGLIYKCLERHVRVPSEGKRRPHLVTFEDPIDRYWANDPETALRTGVDYTPRELHKDVESLSDAVEAALRQTPCVFFSGETRDPDDWKVLLRFATSGHLGMTTSHAGSLTEAMGQLFRAAKADSPARRSEVANSVLALIHLRNGIVGAETGETIAVTAPAIWVRSPVSTKMLMADGLTALLPCRDLPNSAAAPGRAGEFGSLGRTWFADQLIAQGQPNVRTTFELPIRLKALTWDLEGI